MKEDKMKPIIVYIPHRKDPETGEWVLYDKEIIHVSSPEETIPIPQTETINCTNPKCRADFLIAHFTADAKPCEHYDYCRICGWWTIRQINGKENNRPPKLNARARKEYIHLKQLDRAGYRVSWNGIKQPSYGDNPGDWSEDERKKLGLL